MSSIKTSFTKLPTVWTNKIEVDKLIEKKKTIKKKEEGNFVWDKSAKGRGSMCLCYKELFD